MFQLSTPRNCSVAHICKRDYVLSPLLSRRMWGGCMCSSTVPPPLLGPFQQLLQAGRRGAQQRAHAERALRAATTSASKTVRLEVLEAAWGSGHKLASSATRHKCFQERPGRVRLQGMSCTGNGISATLMAANHSSQTSHQCFVWQSSTGPPHWTRIYRRHGGSRWKSQHATTTHNCKAGL